MSTQKSSDNPHELKESKSKDSSLDDNFSAENTAQLRNDLFPNLVVVSVPIGVLMPSKHRARKLSRKHLEELKRSMERYGNRLPILVDRNMSVIDGHARLKAARELGAEDVPCFIVDDLPGSEIRRLALSLNKLQEGGEWDDDALRLEVGELIELDGDYELPGFELPELEAMLFAGNDVADVDPADDVSVYDDISSPPVSTPGDLWFLNKHRIFNGDARENKPVGTAFAHMVFADPPYNVRVNGHVRGRGGKYREFDEACGEKSPAEFTKFLVETLGSSAACVKPGGVLFICMDWRHVGELQSALTQLGLELLNICVWVKSNAGMGSLYRSQHELVFVTRKPGAQHLNNVQLGRFGRNRTNVWNYAGATGGRTDADDDFDVHPTVKPIRMVCDAILDVSKPEDIVHDPFLGSGTTLLAAERTERWCYGSELDPHYVDITIRRWQDMTGQSAIHAKSGRSFDDILQAQEVVPNTDNPVIITPNDPEE